MLGRLGVVPTYSTSFGPAPFTTTQAKLAGLGKAELRSLVTRGLVRRVVRGVFVDAQVADNLVVRAAALNLVVPTGSVIAGRTAAWLWGVDALAMGDHRRLPPVHVMAAAHKSAARRRGVFGSTGPLPDIDVVQVDGVTVTSRSRTAADLARMLARPDALAALDAMLRSLAPYLMKDAVLDVLERFGGCRGVVQARELVAFADPRAESAQESRTRLRIHDAGFPPPEPQVCVLDPAGDFVARLDLGWRQTRKGVEFDGDEYHSGLEAAAHDAARRRRVEALGWQVAVVTSEHVLGRGLAFEVGIAELTGWAPRLTRHHPSLGGWESRSRWTV